MDVNPSRKVSPAQTAEPVHRKTHAEVIATLRELLRQHRQEPVNFSPIYERACKIFMESDTGPSPSLDPRIYLGYGIKADQLRAEMLREKRLEAYRLSQKDSGCLKPGPKVQNAKAKQTAQDANRTLLKKEAQLERKVPENEMEERVLPEPEEEVKEEVEEEVEEEVKEKVEEEVKEVDPEDLTERIMWEYIFFTEEMDEEEKLIKSLENEKEKLQERLNQRDKEMQKTTLLIKQAEDKPENIKSQLSSEDSGVITRRLRVKQYCEKLTDVYMEIFDRSCNPHFPSLILVDLDELTSNLLENMTDEAHVKLLNQFWKHKAMNGRMESEAEMKTRRERRIRERREIALAPPVKIVGKKLMPRMLPPKKVEKKEQDEPKKQESNIHCLPY